MILDKIYNLDCLIGLKELPTESIDLVVSDVPYLIAHKGSNRGGGIFADYKPLVGGGKTNTIQWK